MPDDGSDGDSPDADIAHRRVSTDPDEADYEFLELVAELEGCDVTALPPMHPRIDDIVSEVFSDPPSADAQVEVQFSYFGYRVEMDQAGNVSLMRIPR
ncbi:HalOD1 output domain-containing protein [Halorientalis salina]|uniref:HalOD1 output domain-containing protein n=1 Tax=Halorientalis salina TaxID=2932266 RepID=UPI0010AD91A4|nr:HalOD1 output domain-containing protein [Halorientalis salina]